MISYFFRELSLKLFFFYSFSFGLGLLFYSLAQHFWVQIAIYFGIILVNIIYSYKIIFPFFELIKDIDKLKEGLKQDYSNRNKLQKWFGDGFKFNKIDKESLAHQLEEKSKDALLNALSILRLARKRLKSQSEEIQLENDKISLLSDSMTDALMSLDSKEQIIFANKQFSQNFCENPEEKKIWEIFRQPEIFEKYQRCIEKDKVVKLKAYQLTGLYPNEHYFNVSFSPLRNTSQEVHGVLVVFHDVTDLKTTENMRANFVANVSHEVRTPLTNIIGYGQLIQESLGSLPSEEKKKLSDVFDKIIHNAKRLTTLFEGILELSTIESKGTIHKEAVDVAQYVDLVLSEIQVKYSKSIKCQQKLNISEMLVVPVLFQQVLTNLLDNSFKYLQEGGEINICTYEMANDTILEVSDNGEGIPSEDLPRVFERFYRVDASRSQLVEGTGLGLAIVKHIALIHGGRVWAESEVGNGSRFFAAFPQES